MSSPTFTGTDGPRAGFLDLPMELVLQILHDPDTDLFLLAQGNRYLNALVMRHYIPILSDNKHIDELQLTFAESGVLVKIKCDLPIQPGPPVQRIVMSTQPTNSWPPLPGIPPHIEYRANLMAFLSIAFEIKTIGKLVCRFNHPNNSTPTEFLVETFIQSFDRIARFIQRLVNINKLVLVFSLRNFLYKEIPDKIIKIWLTSLDDLADVCMQKGSCKLKVYGCGFPTDWLTNYRGQISPNMVQRIADVFKSQVSRDAAITKLGWSISRCPTLSGVTLSATLSGDAKNSQCLPYYPRYSTYNYNLPIGLPLSEGLRRRLSGTASLTRLKLESIIMKPEDWKEMLSWLHVPFQETLTTLKVKECQLIPARPLVKFIHRLPRLTHLTLLPPFPAFHYMDPYPISLPNLVAVCAPSDFLMRLCPKTGFSLAFGTLLPKLTSLQIIPVCQYSHGHPYDTPGCQSKVGEVLTAYPTTIPRIALDLRFSNITDFNAWPSSREGVTTNGLYPSDTPTLYPPPTPVYPPSFRRVTEVILSSSLFLILLLSGAPGSLEDFVEFLEPFEGLPVLAIVYDLRPPSVDTPRNGHWMDMIDDPVLKLVKSKCRVLKTVRLEGLDGEVREHDVEG